MVTKHWILHARKFSAKGGLMQIWQFVIGVTEQHTQRCAGCLAAGNKEDGGGRRLRMMGVQQVW